MLNRDSISSHDCDKNKHCYQTKDAGHSIIKKSHVYACDIDKMYTHLNIGSKIVYVI